MSIASIAGAKRKTLHGFWGELSNFCLLTSEMIWAASLFVILFNRKAELGILFFSFMLGAILSYALSIALDNQKLSKSWMRILLLTWYLAAAFIWMRLVVFSSSGLTIWQIFTRPFLDLAEKPYYQSELWQLIFFLFVIRRGLNLPASSVSTWRAVRSSQVGFLMFLFYGLTTSWSDFSTNLIPFIFYLFFLLVAMTTARLAELSQQIGGKTPAFTRSWFVGTAVLALILAGAGSLIGWLLGVVYVELASSIVGGIYAILVVLLVILLSPFILVILLLLPFLNSLVSRLLTENLGLPQAQFLQSLLQPKFLQASNTLNTMNRGLTILIILMVIVILAASIFGFRYRKRRGRQAIEEEIEDLAAVKGYLKSQNRNRPFFQSALDQARQWLAAARIRRIYAQLMKYCTVLDSPRPPSLTPLEFLPQVKLLFPGYEAAAELLTAKYLKTRYGEYPETVQEMQEIVETWEKMKKYAEEQIKLRKKRMRQY